MAEKKSVKPNIVVIIFVFIMIYMTANIIAYLVKPHISITEIEAGHIIDSDSFTGLIIREEKALQTTSSGRVTYIVADGEKVSRGSNICMVGNSSSSQVETDPSEI